MSEPALTLPDTVLSVQDLGALELEIRGYARWFAHNAIKKKVQAGRASEPPAMSAGAKQLLRDWQAARPLSTARLDELIKALSQLKSTAPVVTITLAATPASDLKKTLVAWCRQNIRSDVLVSFQFNSTLLGGLVVRYGSRVFDWSFRRQILENRNKFPEVLKSV